MPRLPLALFPPLSPQSTLIGPIQIRAFEDWICQTSGLQRQQSSCLATLIRLSYNIYECL